MARRAAWQWQPERHKDCRRAGLSGVGCSVCPTARDQPLTVPHAHVDAVSIGQMRRQPLAAPCASESAGGGGRTLQVEPESLHQLLRQSRRPAALAMFGQAIDAGHGCGMHPTLDRPPVDPEPAGHGAATQALCDQQHSVQPVHQVGVGRARQRGSYQQPNRVATKTARLVHAIPPADGPPNAMETAGNHCGAAAAPFKAGMVDASAIHRHSEAYAQAPGSDPLTGRMCSGGSRPFHSAGLQRPRCRMAKRQRH